MTSDASARHDDEHLFLADFYPELGEYLAGRCAAGYDSRGGRARFLAWLIAHAEAVDPVRDYLAKIGDVPPLTAGQEIELGKRIEAGRAATGRLATGVALPGEQLPDLEWSAEEGQRAKNQLLEANLRLVVSLAKRYTGQGMLFLDLIQEGNLGLVRAVEQWDHTRGYRFSTYATWWIRQAITRALASQPGVARVPVHLVEVINRLARVQRQMLRELGREPTPDELAVALDITPEQVFEVQKYGREPVSLVDEGQTVSFMVLQDQLRSAIAGLPELEAGVVRMRFGLTDGQPKTLEEIRAVYDVTNERIRQIEAETMARIRRQPDADGEELG